ncbi:VCBS repeat-containing protein [Streptomyces hirsutus]|uniref:VCBS repeat-containing protein n=1 Tax=Streptomyces hirsutus TaxID=35620 RepID=A0ABZ1GQK9_9ACTN|nr:VCBS repeat-containing protein [Streptomyces hirsutus]WSD08407.1 VCBS repeat-containing protein [Streptomyces hirsutus]
MLGIALTPVLTLAAVAPAAAAAQTTATAAATGTTTTKTTVEKRAPGAWGTRTAHAPGSLRALVSARNGTLVSFADGTRIRPAGSTRWLAPQAWPDAGGYNTELVSLSDGSVRLVWRAADEHNDYWLKMATLAPGATAFSEPEDIAEVPRSGYHHLAATPDGRVTVAWADGGVVMTAEKAGPKAAWTAPVGLNAQPPTGSRNISGMELAVAEDGTALLVWQGSTTKVVTAMEKAPGASGWTTVKNFPLPSVDRAQPKVFANPQGGFELFYNDAGHVMHTRRSAGATKWSTPRSSSASGSTSGMTAPVYLPNGDLFVAGGGPGSTSSWYAVRSAATGAWLPYKQPFSTTRAQAVGAVATSGGTVTVTWRAGSSGHEYVMAAVFKGGTWSAARRLSAASATATGAPRAASDALGRPVVLWDEYTVAQSAYILGGTYQTTTAGRALPKWRDYTDDGKADLFGRSSSGLKVYAGGATKLSAQKRASSWPTGTLVLPFGDLDGDRCNDVFVRYPKGEARIYKPVCGGLPDQQTSSVKVSSNWSGYNAVLSPGDVTGDGRADLLARSASTGKLYLYANSGKGGFKARKLAGSGFGGYKKLIAAGDLNRDGKNDLLALDKSDRLWRFNGTGKGTFKPRALVFKNWGTSYKDVVGGLDLSGDGRADLISLDKNGRAWLNRGDGHGGFGKRSQVGKATNWSGIRIS